MKIFVLHYSKLVDRKKHILEQFQKQNITDYEFIEKYDIEDLQHCDTVLFDTSSYKKSMISLMNKNCLAPLLYLLLLNLNFLHHTPYL